MVQLEIHNWGGARVTLPCFLFSIFFILSFAFRSSRNFPTSLRNPKVSTRANGHKQFKYLSGLPPDLFIRFSLFRFLDSLLRSLLRHSGLQLCEFLFLFLLREGFNLQSAVRMTRLDGHMLVMNERFRVYLLSGFLKLVMTILLCVVVC